MILPLAVIALVASAQPAAKAQGSRLEQGQRAFAEGQLDVALKLLDAAAAEGGDLSTVEKIQMLRGQCLAARQDFGKAEEAFALALDANPEASLDPGKVDPALVKLLESMRARLSGTLDVRTTPSGAKVLIDGAESGVSPVSVTAPIGRHKIEARWDEGAVGPVEVLVRNKRQTVFSAVAVTIEKQVIVKEQVPVPIIPPPSKVRFFGDIRGGADINAGPEGGLDLGVGLEVPVAFMRAELAARVYPYFHLIPRVAAVFPFAAKQFDAFIEVGVPIRFASSGHDSGLGFSGGAGVEWNALNVLALYVELGGTFYFINPSFVVDDRFTVAAGIRLRIPEL